MNGHILKVLLLGFVTACASCHTCSAQDEKLPPPSEDQRREVLKLLQEIYKSEYVAAETAEAKSELATKILDAANETADNAARYSMLKLAADIAVRAADSEIVNESIDLMDRFYEIDEPKIRLAALIGVAKNIDSQSEPAALSAVIGFCRRAIDRNDYVAAQQLLTISEGNFREAASRRELTELASRVKTLQLQFESVRDHLQKLLEDPDDQEANLAVGRFRCFDRNDWSVGLKNLARGSDETLREIAQLELASGNDTDRRTVIADRWWQYAENVEGEVAVRAKLHAGSYYKIAVDSLQGLERAKAATRLREAESLGEIAAIEMIAGGDAAPPKPAAPEPMNEWKVVYEMPASYSDVAVGGSGRYLIFRLDSLKKLAFFDVMKREITQYVPIESSDIRFTAGANEFFIATRPQNVLERWSLETFKRLSTVKLPLENPVEVVMMGSASEGPIYVGAQHGPGGFLNPRSLKPIPYQVVDHRYQRAGEIQGAGPESRVRASANGRAFAMWRTNVSPGGFRTYVLTDRILHTFYQHDTMGYIEPSPDGELMYTSRGVYTSQTKEYLANKGNFATSFRIPAVTGNYAVGVLRDDDRKKKNVNPIHILVSGQVDPILTIPDVSIRTGEYGDFHGRELMTLARRVYLLPNANLLITLPVSNKSLVLHYLDLEQELRESGVDFLYVASRAPTSVKSGGVYKYQLDVKSKQGDVEYEIVAGPSGMRVSNDGLVTWRTPRRGSEQQEAIVLIKDGNGQQTTHTFTVATTL
jgi:hypothetical protein